MSKLWFVMMLLGIANMALLHPEQSVEVMVDACANAVALCIQLAGIYAFWLGILELMEQSGLAKSLAKFCAPLTKKLFPNTTTKAQNAITTNLVANFLGMGNAATPSGIEAMQQMQPNSNTANANMILFVVINSTALQLFPTTVVALRAAHGSTNPSNIFLPTLLSSVAATILGIICCFVLAKLFFKKQKAEL